jgi:hypothetical protein
MTRIRKNQSDLMVQEQNRESSSQQNENYDRPKTKSERQNRQSPESRNGELRLDQAGVLWRRDQRHDRSEEKSRRRVRYLARIKTGRADLESQRNTEDGEQQQKSAPTESCAGNGNSNQGRGLQLDRRHDANENRGADRTRSSRQRRRKCKQNT